jgi:catechol 2,3-dioxygenase-like lactoylglutathione lyase family enzyme
VSAPFVCLDHVQLAIPVGGEAEARRFYRELLGMEEIPKPPRLAARGGLWLRSGAVVIHLGVEADFRAARKAHPALVCASYGALVAKLRASGIAVRDDHEIPGVERCHIDDVFGNRIELIRSTGVVDVATVAP